MLMYCVQVNKLLQILKNDKWSGSKQSLYVVLTYGSQKRRTTCRVVNNKSYLWYESFLFVLDNDETKNIKMEVFDKNSKKNVAVVSEMINVNRSKMGKKTTKYMEIQHGLINYDNDKKLKVVVDEKDILYKMNSQLQDENSRLQDENKKLQDENSKLQDENSKLQDENKKSKELIINIDNLINDDAYE